MYILFLLIRCFNFIVSNIFGITTKKQIPAPEVIFPDKGPVIMFCRLSIADYARSTLPERRQEVQTYIFFVPPFTFTLTDLRFDFHIVLLLL